jgi:type II secretory pathway component GspD/PulD (secretin)
MFKLVKHMNPKLRVLAFLALVTLGRGGLAQTGPSPVADAPASASLPQTPPPASTTPSVSEQAVVVAQATTPAEAPTAAQPAGTAAASVNQGVSIDDLPLTDAIRHLARLAEVNYVLDPNIGFGQLGPDGKPIPQPSVSVRWENVTAQQALGALLNNYNLQLVEDPKTKIARVTRKDPAAPEPLSTKIIQLKFASPSNILNSVQATLSDKRSRVVPDNRTSQLVVLATDKELADVDRLVESLDTETKQVLIETRLFETIINPNTSKGIDWSGTLAAQNVTFGNGSMSGQSTTTLPGTPTTQPGGRTVTPASSASTVLNSILGNGGMAWNTASGFTPGIGFLNADGLRAVLSFLNTCAETKVISTPRTVTLDNEPASIEVGTMYPIVNVTAGTANTTGGSSVSYSNLTVRLDVTPRISANNLVHLKVSPKVLRLGDRVTSVVNGVPNSVDSFNKREMDTTVMIPSGNTLVMGGLIEDNVHDQSTKVPLLGDIPGLGVLFRSESKSRQKSNLLVFLTPTIVQREDFQPTKTDFLKSPVPVKDEVEGDWGSFDSAKPKDWSAPAAGQ